MDALVSCNHFIFLSHMEIALIKIIREKEKESFDVEGHVVSDVEGMRTVRTCHVHVLKLFFCSCSW